MYHKLLQRQIKKYIGNKNVVGPECRAFFQAISDSYTHHDRDRAMLMRAMDLSSDEMLKLNDRIKEESEGLKKSNERYELVTKATQDIIWDWDVERDQMFRSSKYTDLFGFEPPQNRIEGIDEWMQCIHPDEQEKVYLNLQSALANPYNPLWEAEYRHISKNGDYVLVYDRAHIVFGDNDRPQRMVGAMRDVSKEKLLEQDRQKITDDLLRQNRHLEQYAYIISHNLRAPVANIIGFSSIINSVEPTDPVLPELVQGISDESRKLDGIIKDLNKVLQLKKELVANRETVYFQELVDEVRHILREVIKRENAIIETDFTEAGSITAIRSYMHSIFYNLISNSLKYKNPNFSPQISIRSHRFGKTIALTFKDNGLGIDMKTKGGEVFGLYKRFHQNVEGKGMGLYMVKTQVESMNGTIQVESAPMEGTVFMLEITQENEEKVYNH